MDNLDIDTQVAFRENENNVTVHLDDVYQIDVCNGFIKVHCLDGFVCSFECQLDEIVMLGVKML